MCWVLVAGTTAGAQLRPASVLVYDEAEVPAVYSGRARAVVGRILAAAGVELEWLDEPAARARRLSFADGGALGAWLTSLHSVRVVRTIPSDGSVPDARSLGVSVPGTRVATVLYTRIEARAREAGVDVGTVLGHVVAHELGHLLLRRGAHSAAGLMRADLDTTLAVQGRLLFTEAEARAIRAALAPPPR
jgi:hypothetical protein